MNILFVVRGIGYSGAAKQLALTANAMAERGHKVSIYTYNSDKCGQGLQQTVKYIPEKNPPKNSFEEYIRTPLKIRKLLKKNNYDIVIGWRTNAAFDVILATIGNHKVKTLFSERTDPYMENNTKLKIARKFCNYADGGVFQTEKARDFYKGLVGKSVVIPNPVSSSAGLPDIVEWKNRKHEIVCVGRMYNLQKRFDIMLRAFQIMLKHDSSLKLSLYGDGPDLEKNKALAKELGIEKSVTFEGAVDNVLKRVSEMKALVMPSDYEGIPNTIIEAFMAGTPVVATDCSPGGARVLIENTKNGYIVPIGDYVSLANKTLEIISNPVIADSFIEKSRERLLEWSPTPIFDKWEEYLKSIVNE